MPSRSLRAAVIGMLLFAAGCGQGIAPTVVPASPSTAPAPTATPSVTPASTPGQPTAPPDIDAIAARVQAVADELVLTRVGISVFLRVGADERTLVAGVASRSPLLDMAPGVRFQIASITKPMTATVVLSLVDAGTLSLDDPVAKWLPGLLKDGGKITIDQLLSHASGLFNFTRLEGWSWATQTYTATQLVRLAEAHGPAFAPGAGAEYSNTGYVVLGLIVEAATGRTLADAMHDVVFGPADMRSASLGTSEPPGLEEARGYADGVDVTTGALDGSEAAAGVVATANDVGRFLDALFKGQLLDLDTVAEMAAVHSQLNGGDSYGYGLDHIEIDCGPLIGHMGSLPGFTTDAWRRIDGTRTVVVLINDEPDSAEITPLLSAALCD
jgi:D-alanyl-D-alanine carboxypeptidase